MRRELVNLGKKMLAFELLHTQRAKFLFHVFILSSTSLFGLSALSKENSLITNFGTPPSFNKRWDNPAKIILSPFNKGNILVLYSYEFNPFTKEWIPLSKIIGEYVWGCSGSIFKDNYNKNLVWIWDFHRRLLKYNLKSKTYEEYDSRKYFDGNDITSLLVDRDCVWIGTSDGLYKYIQATKEVKAITKTKGIRIRELGRTKNAVWISGNYKGNYKYYPLSGKLELADNIGKYKLKNVRRFKFIKGLLVFDTKKGTIIGDSAGNAKFYPNLHFYKLMLDGKNLWIASNRLIKIDLEKEDTTVFPINMRNAHLLNGKKRIWFASDRFSSFEGVGCIDKENGHIWMIKNKDLEGKIAQDERFLWINSKKGLFRIRKQGIEKILIKYKEYKKERNKINKRIRELSKIFEEDIIRYIQTAYNLLGLASIREKQRHSIYWDMYGRLKRINESQFQSLSKYLQKNPEDKLKEALYYALSLAYLHQGKLDTFYIFFKKIYEEFPESPFLYRFVEKDIEKAEKWSKRYKEIKEKYKHDRERLLWELSNLFFEASKIYWNAVEVGCNMDLPFNTFKELIKEFPESKWADNAEYKMLLYNDAMSHEGGDQSGNLQIIEEYKRFIKKYPSSELLPEAYLEIGRLYFYYIYPCESGAHNYLEEKEYIDSAKYYYNKVIMEYSHTEWAKKSKEELKELNKFVTEFQWSLKIELVSDTFSTSQPVIVKFILKNISNQTKKIKISKNLPNFSVWVERLGGGLPSFIKVDVDSTIQIEKVIPPGGEYVEEHNLKKLIISEYNNQNYGRFEFKKPGEYKITGYFKIGYLKIIKSNEVVITIKEE